MNTNIQIEVKSNYGAPAFYVVSEHKEFIQVLTRRITIDANDIAALRNLGFSVSQVAKNHALFN